MNTCRRKRGRISRKSVGRKGGSWRKWRAGTVRTSIVHPGCTGAQSPFNAQGRLQTRGREGTDGQQILRRDGGRCQSCGAMTNLEVHHREFRSHSGADAEENLITPVHGMPRQSASPLRPRTGSHRRATAIDDTKNCQKPLFASLGVSSSDLFDGGIEVGMGGPGRVPQSKRKPGTGRSQEGLLTRPADKRSPGSCLVLVISHRHVRTVQYCARRFPAIVVHRGRRRGSRCGLDRWRRLR
jgi:hypothetical protein